MDIITYALCKSSPQNTVTSDSISVNSNGELVVSTTLPFIRINTETGYLETNTNIFSVNQEGYLISEV